MESQRRSRRRRRKSGRLTRLFQRRGLIVVLAWTAGFVVVLAAMFWIVGFMDLV